MIEPKPSMPVSRDDVAETSKLHIVVFELIRTLIFRMGLDCAQATVVCRAAERTMRIGGERSDFSEAIAREAVEAEIETLSRELQGRDIEAGFIPPSKGRVN